MSKKYKREAVARDICTIFNAPDSEVAERLLKKTVDKSTKEMPQLASWVETNISEGFTVFILSSSFRSRLQTINMAERPNRGIKRRA